MYRQPTFSTTDYSLLAAGLVMIASGAIATSSLGTIEPPSWITHASVSSTAISIPQSDHASHAIDAAATDQDEVTLRKKLDRLHRGREYLATHGCYTATMTKQESVRGELLPEQTISLKCRQEPFSVYLHWQSYDPGREVLYVEGENNGKLIGHDGGWKARIPAVSIKPESSLAMRDTRYAVTKAGLGGLSEIMIGVHQNDLQNQTFAKCTLREHVTFDSRDCDEFTTVYKNAQLSPTYRKSVTLIDREWNLPLASRHYEWPQKKSEATGDGLDAETLIESYAYSQVDFQQHYTDADFTRDNSEYGFR